MKLKSKRIKELEHKNLELSRRLDSTKRHLDFAERAIRDRNEKIVELRGQIEEREDELQLMKERQERLYSSLCDYVSFYESLNTLIEGFAERRVVCSKGTDKEPKIFTVDLTKDIIPEALDVCELITDIIASLLGEED